MSTTEHKHNWQHDAQESTPATQRYRCNCGKWGHRSLGFFKVGEIKVYASYNPRREITRWPSSGTLTMNDFNLGHRYSVRRKTD